MGEEDEALRESSESDMKRACEESDHIVDKRLRNRFWPGQELDVLDTVSKWAEAEVVAVDEDMEKILVTYVFWSDKWDEWIDFDSERVAARGAKTYAGSGLPQVGQRIEAKDETGRWLEAEVLKVNPDDAYVHYKNYHKKFDQWISHRDPKKDLRLKPFRRSGKKVIKKVPLREKIDKYHKKTTILADPLPLTPSTHRPVSARVLAERRQPPQRKTQEEEEEEEEEPRRRRLPETDTPHRQPRETSLSNERPSLLSGGLDVFERYSRSLEKRGLGLVRVAGDGNCLFRSVSHQVYGDDSHHAVVRSACLDYMEAERTYFEPYVSVGWEQYVAEKRELGSWGDEPELQALCELYNRSAQVWSYDADKHAATVIRAFGSNQALLNHAEDQPPRTGGPPMRLSYYGGGHYDSIIPLGGGGGASHHSSQPRVGDLEAAGLSRRCLREKDQSRRRTTVLDDERAAIILSDAEATDAASLETALTESRRLFDARDVDLESALRASLAVSAETTDVDSLQASIDAQALRQAEEAELNIALQASSRDQDDSDFSHVLQSSTYDAAALDDANLAQALQTSVYQDIHQQEDQDLMRAIAASLDQQ